MNSHIIKSTLDLASIKDAWDRIYSESDTENPFSCWEWNNLWINTFFMNGDINIIVIYDANEIICIAPFLIKHKTISFLADNLFADYSDIITSRPDIEVLQIVIREMLQIKGWSKLSLMTIPEFSQCLAHFEPIFKNEGVTVATKCVHLNPFVDTTTNFEEYIAARSNGVRKELRRSKNKLDKTYSEWDFFEAESTNDKIEVLNALIDLHLRRQPGKVGTSIFENYAHVEFYRNLVKNKELPWTLHLAGIRVDGKFVTASISIIKNDVFYYWMTAFDASVGGGSIGNLHVKFLTQKCFSQEFKRLDFMGGTEGYKMRWATESYKNFEVVAYRSSIRFYADKTWAIIRRRLQILKDHHSLVNKVWTRLSKFVGK